MTFKPGDFVKPTDQCYSIYVRGYKAGEFPSPDGEFVDCPCLFTVIQGSVVSLQYEDPPIAETQVLTSSGFLGWISDEFLQPA